MNPRVFWSASAIVIALLVVAIAAPGESEALFSAAQGRVIDLFGWFYIAVVAGFLAFVLFVAVSPLGRVRLGPDDAEPDFPYVSWLAMLFAAGMGIGLMYFAVAEPVQHYASPPEAPPKTFAAAREAMVITFTHWGVHAWAVYAVTGLSLAYFAHRKGMPLVLRSGLRPLLGRRTDGVLGDAVDVFAICGTLFGIATSLGLGVTQINAGLDYLFGVPNLATTQVVLIAVVMAAATVSVVSGVDRGIRRLSELNLIVAVLLMLFVLLAGPTVFLLKALIQNFGLYLDHFFVRTFNLYAYEPRGWMASWTLFYWAWWIAWSPFVGMFIARISRGRTVREFIIGVLLVPSGFSFIWMTVFGNTAIALDMERAAGAIASAVEADISTALFRFLEYLPGEAITSALAILLVAVFFVTSADSGSLVIDTIASGGSDETPAWQRVYWCLLEGAAAALLLLAGGLTALQAATLVAALPFAAIMILLAFGLYRALAADVRGGLEPASEAPLRLRLQTILKPPTRRDIDARLKEVGEPALAAVHDALDKENVETELTTDEGRTALATSGPAGRFVYALEAVSRPLAAFSPLDAAEGRRTMEWRMRAVVGEPPLAAAYDVTDLTRDGLIDDVLDKLGRWRSTRSRDVR